MQQKQHAIQKNAELNIMDPCGFTIPNHEICYLIRRAHQRAAVIFQEIMKEYDLTPTQYAVVVKMAELGEMSQNHLGRLVAMDPATNQGVVRRLLKRGLIRQRHDPNDKRRLLLSLNPAFRAVIENVLQDGNKICPVILSPLSPEERDRLYELLRKIG